MDLGHEDKVAAHGANERQVRVLINKAPLWCESKIPFWEQPIGYFCPYLRSIWRCLTWLYILKRMPSPQIPAGPQDVRSGRLMNLIP
jgi:hypothetical protein